MLPPLPQEESADLIAGTSSVEADPPAVGVQTARRCMVRLASFATVGEAAVNDSNRTRRPRRDDVECIFGVSCDRAQT